MGDPVLAKTALVTTRPLVYYSVLHKNHHHLHLWHIHLLDDLQSYVHSPKKLPY